VKFVLSILILFSFLRISIAQENIELLVLEKVNSLRDSLKLSSLRYDNILSEAGQDHAYYISRKQKLTHFQSTFTKETPAARVEYYNGNRTYIGENVAMVPVKYVQKDSLSTALIAEKLFSSWLNSPPHYQNMINAEYTHMGIGYSVVNKKQLYAAQVFSSNEIQLPKAFKNEDRSWGVRPSEFTCKDETQTYETMFFANSIQVEGSSVYFYFHDLEFFKKVIRNDNDGLALDVVLREQLPCSKENQFHISTIHDGEMQRPIYKNDIYRSDISNNPKKIKIKIGEVPSHLRNKQWAPNIIIINNNKLCDYSFPIEVPSDIFPLLEIKPYYNLNDNEILSTPKTSMRIKDSIHIELKYERSQKQFFALNTEELYRLLEWSNFIKEIDVECYASVEGAAWFNSQLLEDRKQSVSVLLEANGFIRNNFNIQAAENWSEMNSQIEQFSIDPLKNKTQSQIKYYLKKNKSTYLDSLLFIQRKTHIYATVDTTLELTNFSHFKFASYYDSTLKLSILPLNKILRENYILVDQKIETSLVDSLKEHTELKTNLLGAVSIQNVNQVLDSNLVTQLLLDIDTTNSKQAFNYAHFLTKYWFSKFSQAYETKGVALTASPNQLLAMVSGLDSSIIEKKDIDRLSVNILLSGIHYYVAHNNWHPVDDYFEAISDLVKLNNFSAQEAMELALFCNHFHKFKIAVKILQPFHADQLLSENGYFVLAKTASLIRGKLDQAIYREYMASAKKANHNRYCEWLNNSFQIQRDEFIKKDFCNECK
jgi:hypothetical protein